MRQSLEELIELHQKSLYAAAFSVLPQHRPTPTTPSRIHSFSTILQKNNFMTGNT